MRLSLDALFCGMPVPVFVTDQNNRIAFVNEEFTRVLGWPAAALADRNRAVLHERADLAPISNGWSRCTDVCAAQSWR